MNPLAIKIIIVLVQIYLLVLQFRCEDKNIEPIYSGLICVLMVICLII